MTFGCETPTHFQKKRPVRRVRQKVPPPTGNERVGVAASTVMNRMEPETKQGVRSDKFEPKYSPVPQVSRLKELKRC